MLPDGRFNGKIETSIGFLEPKMANTSHVGEIVKVSGESVAG